MDINKIKLSFSTKLMITILPIGVLVILWLYVFHPEKPVEQQSNNNKTVFIPEKKTGSDTIESKSLLYDKEKDRLNEMEQKQKREKLSVNDIIEITEKRKATQQSERETLREKLYGELTQEAAGEQKNEKPVQKEASQIKSPNSVREKMASPTIVKSVVSNEEDLPNQTEQKKEYTPQEETYSFGVYNSTSNNESFKENNPNYLFAFLEKNIDLKDGAEPVFVLKNPGTVMGIKLDKMAVLYGIAKFDGNRWNIYINKALNTDGKYYNVYLVGYNKNMQRGIFYEGRADNALNESVNESMETTTDAIVGNGFGRILRSGTKALEQKPELPLEQGYVMYFKEENRKSY